MPGKYDDIIHLPRPVSDRHAPMSLADRAAQFSPFAALTGYDQVIRETARLTDQRIALDEDRKAELSDKLRLLLDNLHLHPRVTVLWFREDSKKAGGAYIGTTGYVKKIDLYTQTLRMEDGTAVPIHRLYDLTGDLFRYG